VLRKEAVKTSQIFLLSRTQKRKVIRIKVLRRYPSVGMTTE